MGSTVRIALVGALAAWVALAGCSAARPLRGHEVLGAGTSTPLVLDAATRTQDVKVSRSTARHSVEHPFAAPELASGLKSFGLAYVTGDSFSTEGFDSPPTYKHRLAWVGIYEISKSGDHSCPRAGVSLPANLPPVLPHYYFAVLVDATTGQQSTWNEDMSGLLLRDCAGAPTH